MRLIRHLSFWILLLALTSLAGTSYAEPDYTIKLKTGEFIPTGRSVTPALATAALQKHILIQFEGPLTNADMQRLRDEGIELLDYVPNFTFTAKLNNLPDQATIDQLGVRWLDQIQPYQKISPYLSEVGIRDYSRRENGRAEFIVIFHPDEDPAYWAEQWISTYSAEIVGADPLLNSVELIVPETVYLDIAEFDVVLWVEQALPEPEEYNNSSRANMNVDIIQLPPIELDGDGVTVAEWDGGRADYTHPDMEIRVIPLDNSPFSNHATHVAGTVIGNGTSRTDRAYRGMAPAARLLTQEWWSSSSNMVSEYTQAISAYDAAVATNSWGYGVGDPATEAACEASMGNYISVCVAIDNVVRGDAGEPITIVWSAGNQRGSASKYCGSIGWTYNTVTQLPTSKNVIAVGAVNSNNSSMTSFSSWGPTDDGRVKPDVTGPGCQTTSDYAVTSCREGGGYTSMCGTSMSAPAVAGVLTLMKEQWDRTFGTGTLLPSTMKGILVNSATDLGNAGPDYQFGHGNVDALKAVTKMGIGEPSWLQSEMATGDVHVYDLTVPGNAPLLRVSLVWDDPGGIVSASQNLKNDLDLVLVDPLNNEVYPWILDPDNPAAPATRGPDRLNNVISVGVHDPMPGLWKARVSGYNIPDGPQAYSLVFTPDSINTPGNLAALAAIDGGDLTVDPGVTTDVEYWIVNVGANPDSVQVTITDQVGWAHYSVDTSFYLDSWDSAYVPVTVTIPAEALAGDSELLTCDVVSINDPLVTAHTETAVITALVWDITLTQEVFEDTVFSPETYYYDVTVHNDGNGTATVTVMTDDDAGWSFNPWQTDVPVAIDDSVTVTITINVPAEEDHLSVNSFTTSAMGAGPILSEANLSLVVRNPLFPPELMSPAPETYMQDRTPDFTWSGEADSSVLYVATDPGMSSNLLEYRSILGNSFTLPEADSLEDGGYFWAVKRYLSPDSSSIQLNPFTFSVDNTPPLRIFPVQPKTNIYTSEVDITFTFDPEETAVPPYIAPEYGVFQLARDSNFSVELLTVEPIDSSMMYTTTSLEQGRWYWRVWKTDAAGNDAPISPTRTFLIDTVAPPTPTLLAPDNGASLSGDSLTWRWSVTDVPPEFEISPEYFWVHFSKEPDFSDWSSFAGYVYTDSLRLSLDEFDQMESYYWRVKANDSAAMYSDFSDVWQFTTGNGICGDLNDDGQITLSDISRLIDHLYISKSPLVYPELGNVNGSIDGMITLSDITRLIDHLYISKLPLECL